MSRVRSRATVDAARGQADAQTPARRLELPVRDGCRMLGAAGDWRDGGEARVLEILEQAGDVSSFSEDLAGPWAGWVERYHLSPERANVVRALDLPADARVLELGAGCGAVTRHLGEVAAAVDALEPTAARARAARVRTRDLPSVEVFVGEAADLPPEPAYDVVVIVGVLEWLGGPAALAERVELLRGLAARLLPGGTIACAIENRLGVKYLAGADEDHAATPFEGLEDYPHAGAFATWSRPALLDLFARAGLDATVLHLFPDYKLARLVFDDSLLDSPAASLAWRVPSFPSYDQQHARPKLASERRLWRELVRAGLGSQFANSFLVLAGHGTPGGLWPEGRRAVFYSTGRRPRFSTETRVERDGAEIAMRRRYLAGGPRRAGALTHRCTDSAFVAGASLLELMEDAADGELAALVRRWREHAGALPAGAGGRNVDPLPQNVLDAGGRLVDIDEEWLSSDYAAADVVDRGLLHIAIELAQRRAPARWPEGVRTLGDLVAHLGREVDLAARLDGVLRREAELQTRVQKMDDTDPGWAAAVAEEADALRRGLDTELSAFELGVRDPVALRLCERQVRELAAENGRLWERVDLAEARLEAVQSSRAWRAVTTLRRLKSLPPSRG
jgi:SAM-dependent methyltransferase